MRVGMYIAWRGVIHPGSLHRKTYACTFAHTFAHTHHACMHVRHGKALHGMPRHSTACHATPRHATGRHATGHTPHTCAGTHAQVHLWCAPMQLQVCASQWLYHYVDSPEAGESWHFEVQVCGRIAMVAVAPGIILARPPMPQHTVSCDACTHTGLATTLHRTCASPAHTPSHAYTHGFVQAAHVAGRARELGACCGQG